MAVVVRLHCLPVHMYCNGRFSFRAANGLEGKKREERVNEGPFRGTNPDSEESRREQRHSAVLYTVVRYIVRSPHSQFATKCGSCTVVLAPFRDGHVLYTTLRYLSNQRTLLLHLHRTKKQHASSPRKGGGPTKRPCFRRTKAGALHTLCVRTRCNRASRKGA